MLINDILTFVNSIYTSVTVVLATWGMVIIFIFIMNISIRNVLLQTNRLMKDVRIDQIKLKKPSHHYLFFKRLFDICLSILGLIVLLPLLFLTGILIKIDSPGQPIFYTTKRIGLNGKTFNHFKFRTMITDAKEHYESVDTLLRILRTDSRVTRIGRFVRATALDEIPSLINILRGDMSFVGRSRILEFPEVTTTINPEIYNALLAIRPGFVSLWSISYDMIKCNTEQILFYDLIYISRMSFLFDLKIISRSPVVAIGIAGGY